MKIFCWHNWSEWKEYTTLGRWQITPYTRKRVPYNELRKQRYCIKCNKKQDREVK